MGAPHAATGRYLAGFGARMKRYAVFVFHTYYPGGGWEDFEGAYSTLEVAREAAHNPDYENFQIVDLQELKVVE